jgi:hypothetical protein
MVVLLVGVVAVGCGKDDGPKETALDAGTLECERDDVSKPELASALSFDEAQDGYICPEGDRDWYKVEIPGGETILDVSLAMAVPLSPVEASYALWTIDPEGGAGSVVAAPAFTAVGETLDNVHCMEPGEYLLSVNDAGDDSSDLRNSYELSVKTSADGDQNEPNNTKESATVLSSGQTATGFVTCPGDQDRFAIDVPAGNLVKIHLESEIATYEPKIELSSEDDDVLVQQINRSGRVRSTVIDRFATLPSAGRYYVTVTDDDDFDSDPDVPYELTVDFVPDTDANEPNNSTETATPLSQTPVSCADSWSSTVEMTGTIGAPGDNDWFEVPLQNCAGGIIEADLSFDTSSMSDAQKWEFSTQVQASIAMVIPETNSPCNDDAQCNALQVSCSDGLDCAGLLEQCLPDGLCAGASVCLPGGFCGANRVQRNYTCNPRLPECQAANSPAPPPNQARFAAPLPQGSPVFLRVSDFQANAAAPDTTYRLSVRVRSEPDTHEPSNVFTNELQSDIPVGAHLAKSSKVPVYDCTGLDPTCCASSAWTSGAISYENDLDWYTYDHPCPGEDCMLKFHYQADGGSVDTVINVYTGSRPWYTVLSAEQEDTQASVAGSVGGTATSDRCFYSFQGHTGDPYEYGVLVRDVRELYSDALTPIPASRDWDPDQSYSFCVEKVFDGCDTPCEVAENGECTTP